ncbi:uncharacterized protein N7515_009909 [Penicillium bovifimosum]|uniref:Uncharacterized protein n=1 Tax=Penicillium bovifimosum TaxID=126998 RepID=A0A9W9GHU9_9EURO|nr:uncharacterized protein N7515_009909 [Penicillium bovifimosum]KAJ5120521.1 hypothetical protein N7515_009909 [Penicillium bovifimosum]
MELPFRPAGPCYAGVLPRLMDPSDSHAARINPEPPGEVGVHPHGHIAAARQLRHSHTCEGIHPYYGTFKPRWDQMLDLIHQYDHEIGLFMSTPPAQGLGQSLLQYKLSIHERLLSEVNKVIALDPSVTPAHVCYELRVYHTTERGKVLAALDELQYERGGPFAEPAIQNAIRIEVPRERKEYSRSGGNIGLGGRNRSVAIVNPATGRPIQILNQPTGHIANNGNVPIGRNGPLTDATSRLPSLAGVDGSYGWSDDDITSWILSIGPAEEDCPAQMEGWKDLSQTIWKSVHTVWMAQSLRMVQVGMNVCLRILIYQAKRWRPVTVRQTLRVMKKWSNGNGSLMIQPPSTLLSTIQVFKRMRTVRTVHARPSKRLEATPSVDTSPLGPNYDQGTIQQNDTGRIFRLDDEGGSYEMRRMFGDDSLSADQDLDCQQNIQPDYTGSTALPGSADDSSNNSETPLIPREGTRRLTPQANICPRPALHDNVLGASGLRMITASLEARRCQGRYLRPDTPHPRGRESLSPHVNSNVEMDLANFFGFHSPDSQQGSGPTRGFSTFMKSNAQHTAVAVVNTRMINAAGHPHWC